VPQEKSKLSSKKSKTVRVKATKVARKTSTKAIKTVAPNRHFEGFMEFIRTQGVVGIAIGLVLGTQIKAVVDSFIISFINPLLGLLLPGSGELGLKTFTISIGAKSAQFAYGAFILVFLSFIVVAFVVYFIVKTLKLDRLEKPKE
jgi:large conductance mechanosensitive channel